MVDYNTHGGYFAPQGLMKINEGGSHEENPNGGVQLGVDQQGIPNLVEEDEMVYNDFVYSDNIKADGGFLEKNNLPKKYAGKFYSEIAEALCDEIGEQNDPISLNGLNASLGRLANSQEEQKAAEEEAKLMKMLQEMSPEELAALEQALVEQQAPEQQVVPEEQIQPEVVPEQVGAEEVAPEQIAPAVPMMANGGLLNTFDGGGRVGSKGQMALNFLRDVADFISPIEQKEIVLPDGSVGKVQYAVPPMVDEATGAIKGAVGNFKKTRALRRLGRHINNYKEPVFTSGFKKALPWLTFGAASGIGAANLVWGDPDIEGAEHDYVYDPNDFALGGPANIYAEEGQMDTIDPAYKVGFMKIAQDPYYYFGARRNPELNVLNNYRLINSATYGNDLIQMAGSNWLNRHQARGYGNTVQYVPQGESTPINLGDLDETIITSTSGPLHETSFTRAGNNTVPVASRREVVDSIAKLGPIENKARNSGIIEGMLPYVNDASLQGPGIVSNSGSNPVGYSDWTGERFAGQNSNADPAPDNGGFDWRYLSPAIDAAMGLATLAAPEDHYEYNPIHPYLPYGRIRQQYDRYNPLDQNMVTNQMQAQANATMAALRNAGLGPSTGAQIIGAGYSAGQNMGNALANVWDANNQRYNQVVNQHNAADSTTAQFDWGVEGARANALNQFAPYNQRMALQTQMLNNQAEQDKYNAIGSYVDSAKQFFANKGTEDLNRNMVNSNRAFLGYGIDRMNNVVYDKYGNPILLAKCGGSIKKK